jgi:hypothetical protein
MAKFRAILRHLISDGGRLKVKLLTAGARGQWVAIHVHRLGWFLPANCDAHRHNPNGRLTSTLAAGSLGTNSRIGRTPSDRGVRRTRAMRHERSFRRRVLLKHRKSRIKLLPSPCWCVGHGVGELRRESSTSPPRASCREVNVFALCQALLSQASQRPRLRPTMQAVQGRGDDATGSALWCRTSRGFRKTS